MTTLQGGVLALGLVVAVPALGRADGYTQWVKDEKRQTYSCDYVYTTKDGKTNKQYVVVYYGAADRSGWAYFFNSAARPWTRCAVPGNAKYSARAMYWEALKAEADGYEPFRSADGKVQPDGYCPAPKDGKNPIPAFPLPPK
jgi:hypothetical protein